MSEAHRLAWLRLARSDGIGPVTFARLIETYGEPQRALDAVPGLARRGGRAAPLKLMPAGDAKRELDTASKLGARLLIWTDPDFPPLLRAVDPAPPLIYALGDARLLSRKAVAIVGARNASAGGRKLAEDIAAGLSAAGMLVVSGLARGIDTAAHIGSVAAGTVAVLAGGVDNVYPPENAKLHARIAAEGVIVSEMPPGTTPQAAHFPRRNRIISGLALGTVVVEAAIGSGSLITARYALEQNREVFAVPGSPIDPRTRGCNDLIRNGATLTETADDVLAALPAARSFVLREPEAAPPTPPDDSAVDNARPVIVELLGPTPVAIDEIIRRAGLPASIVMSVLLELELAGRLHRSAGQMVALL